MAYTKTVWKDEIVQHPKRFTATENDDGSLELEPDFGTVIVEGTEVNADNLNKIENGIFANSQDTEYLAENTRNLFYVNTITSGKYIGPDGVIYEDDGCDLTDYIQVTGDFRVKYEHTGYTLFRIAFYNSEKVFQKREDFKQSKNFTATWTGYIRAVLFNSGNQYQQQDYATVMISNGTDDPPYAGYYTAKDRVARQKAEQLEAQMQQKQNVLTAGSHITIANGVISGEEGITSAQKTNISQAEYALSQIKDPYLNLLDLSTITKGEFITTTGETGYGSGTDLSDYIQVSGNFRVKYEHTGYTLFRIAFYNSDKVFQKRQDFTQSNNFVATWTGFIRVILFNSDNQYQQQDYSTVMISNGTDDIPYAGHYTAMDRVARQKAEKLEEQMPQKQNVLTAGSHITIANGVISGEEGITSAQKAQLNKATQDIAELTSASVNLFDASKITSGKYIGPDGNEYSDAGTDLSDYIQVSGVFRVKYEHTGYTLFRIAFYNSDKVFQKREDFTASNSFTATWTGYIRAVLFNSNNQYQQQNYSSIMISKLVMGSLGIVTPEMFGAVGDGVADDSEAVQQAILTGGMIVCANRYRIKKNVELNFTKDLSDNELGIKVATVIGRGKNTSLANSSSTLSGVSDQEATFIFDGGSFTLRGTSKVDFEKCVFMGDLGSLKTNTAFDLTAPARKLNISDCTFANLKYGIHCDNGSKWSGESIYKSLYFMFCEIGIYYENGGVDCEITDSIWQGNCDHALILKGSLACLFNGNHDYSRLGCEFWGGANITGNYFDGLGKLKISCSMNLSASTADPKKWSTHGTVITGNTFLTTFHNQKTVEAGYIAMVTNLSEYFCSCVITDNKLNGGYDTCDVVVVDLTGVSYCADNTVMNNTGGFDAVFKGSTNSNNGYYKNNYGDFTPVFEYDSERFQDVRTGILHCDDGIIAFIRVNNPRLDTNGIKLKNVMGNKVNSITFRTDYQNNLTMYTNSSTVESLSDGNSHVTIFFVEFGQHSLIDRLFTI